MMYMGKRLILQRHRHRYEFNNEYKDIIGQHGLVVSGMNEARNLVEIVQIKESSIFCGKSIPSRIFFKTKS